VSRPCATRSQRTKAWRTTSVPAAARPRLATSDLTRGCPSFRRARRPSTHRDDATPKGQGCQISRKRRWPQPGPEGSHPEGVRQPAPEGIFPFRYLSFFQSRQRQRAGPWLLTVLERIQRTGSTPSRFRKCIRAESRG
jgi:hypothetical protein